VRGEAFPGVGAAEAEELVGQAGVEDRRLRPVPVVERVLGPPDCRLGATGEVHRNLQRPVLDGVVVDAQRDEADAFGLLAGQLVARQQVVLLPPARSMRSSSGVPVDYSGFSRQTCRSETINLGT
jgi:hypothetical protein